MTGLSGSRAYSQFSATCFGVMVLLVGWMRPTDCFSAPPEPNPSNAPIAGGVQVTGVAVNEDGAAVAGAQVSLLRRGRYVGKPDPRTVVTAADGQFVFDGVAQGDYRVWAILGSLSSTDKRTQGQIIHVPKAGEKFEAAKITLHPGKIIRATVTSDDGGMPIMGATVRLVRVDALPDATTDADGHASIQAITADSCDIEAFAPGKAKLSKTVTFTSGTEIAVDFALAEGGSLLGKTTDASGLPLAGIGINVYPGNSGTWIGYVQSGADGSHVLDHLPLNQSYRVLFDSDEYANDWETFELSSAKRQVELNVRIKPKPEGGSVIGTVVDATGNPLAAAHITYSGHSSTYVKHVPAEANGGFRVDGIEFSPTMPSQIIVRAEGWAPVAVNIDQPGTKAEPAQVSACMREKGHTIAGRVVNEKGDPLKGVHVEGGAFSVFDNRAANATTDEEGKFKFDSLAAKATFRLSAEGYSEISWKHLPLDGNDEVTVEMQPLASIVGTVVDANTNQPVPKFNFEDAHNEQDGRRLRRADRRISARRARVWGEDVPGCDGGGVSGSVFR